MLELIKEKKKKRHSKMPSLEQQARDASGTHAHPQEDKGAAHRAVASRVCHAKAATFQELCLFQLLPSPPPTLKKRPAQTRDLGR